MRASYDTYMNHGNSSSATIIRVLDRLRDKEMDALAPGGKVRERIVACAFGPGITVEMCLLKRGARFTAGTGMETPPETESEAGGGSERDEGSEVGGSPRDEEAFISDAVERVDLD
jgi:type III polyketide synthase